MQVASVTEIVSHFIGLLHLSPDPEREWRTPDGAGNDAHGVYSSATDVSGISHPDSEALSSSAGPLPPLVQSADVLMKSWHAAYHPLAGHNASPVAFAPTEPLTPPDLGDAGVGGSSHVQITTIQEIGTAAPWTGADQTVDDVHQVNFLFADTAYVDHLAGPLPIPDGTARLDQLAQEAHATIPAQAPALGYSDSQEIPIFKAFGDGLASGTIAAHADLTTGTYVDGRFVADGGAPVPLTLPVTSLSTETPTANGIALGQTIETGHDVAGNEALVLDTSAAHATTIVMGDTVHANLIVQTNVMEEMARVGSLDPDGAMAPPLVGGDTATNIAHFSQMPLTLTTSVTGSLGTLWNVQVVNGDFYDINAVTQQNVIVNDTLYASAPSTDHSYAVLGGNTQLNEFSITHEAPTYDLLIVLGNSYTANAIYQQNVLLNNADVGVATPHYGDGTQPAVTTGHDSLSNEAAIADYGTSKWSALTPDLQHLVSDLAAHGDAAGQFAGLPSLSGTVNVMIVTGDYYNLNLISQTNLVTNNASVLADLTTAGQGVPVAVHTGSDTLANSAAIVTAGATAAQYVHGGQYETSMLIQSNLVSAHTETTSGSATAFVPELVAFLDTDHAKDVGATQAAPAHTIDTSHHDMIGSIAA